MESGADKYRRFTKMVPTQEQVLEANLANAEKNRNSMEDDLQSARQKYSPKGRKKKTKLTQIREEKKAQRIAEVEAKIEEHLGSREEQKARLPKRNKKEDGDIWTEEHGE